jgi:hypothetical protein
MVKLDGFTLRNANVELAGESTATLRLDGKLGCRALKSVQDHLLRRPCPWRDADFRRLDDDPEIAREQ